MSLKRCHSLVAHSMALLLLWALFCLTTTSASTTIDATSTATATTAANIENDILRFSYELEQWLDVSKRPCQDFYGYVCGRSLNSSQAQLEQRLQKQQAKFEQFLAADDNDEQLMDAELKLKHFFVSCKSARSVDDLKSSLMYRLSGGWPAIDDSAAMIRKRRNVTWIGVLSAFHDVGVEYFFRTQIDIKSNKRVVYLQPDVEKRYTLRKFEQLAGEVMQEYAVEAGRARLVALETLSFERSRRELLKLEQPDDSIELSYSDFKTTLFGNALQIDWDAYFRRTLGKPLRASDTVVVRQLPKLVQLFELVQNATMTRLLNWIWIDYLMDKSSTDCQSLAESYFESVYQHIVERSSIDRVQMAQMYSEIGRAYDELLPATAWIDEMSQQNSKQFLGRIIHLTLNGDAKLDEDLAELTVTKRNFYRNLEKTQRFVAQQRRVQTATMLRDTSNGAAVSSQAATDFMKVFLTINSLLQQQNLTTPLNYALVGERFAERMIAGGSSSSTPGAWRSMDSEREFVTLKQCIGRQTPAGGSALKYNLNDLLLRMLAQHQTLHALQQWQQQKDASVLRRVDGLLASGRLQLSLRKLYFIGALLADCRQYSGGGAVQKEFVHGYLRNSQEFGQAFGCRVGDELYARNACKVMQAGRGKK